MYTKKVAWAIDKALSSHDKQFRKGNKTPYASHLLAVTSMVIECGGSEDAICAAVLHDLLEDQPDCFKEDEFLAVLGPHAVSLIKELTLEKVDFKAITKELQGEFLKFSREQQIEKLKTAHPDVVLIKAADTLHNLTSVLEQYREIGEATFKSFRGGADLVIWNYEERLKVFRSRGPRKLAVRIYDTLRTLQEERMKKRIKG